MAHNIDDRLRDAVTCEKIKRAELDSAAESMNLAISLARSASMKWAEIAQITGLDDRALQHRHAKWVAAKRLLAEGHVASQLIPVELAAEYRTGAREWPEKVPEEVARAYLDSPAQAYARLRRAGFVHFDSKGDVTADSLRATGQFLDVTSSIEDAAAEWGVGRTTVDRWIRAGKVTPAAFPGAIAPGGDHTTAPGRISTDELERVRVELEAERRAAADPDLLTDQQVADLAGVSRPTVFYAAQRGDLARDPSGRVSKAEAERWAAARAAQSKR